MENDRLKMDHPAVKSRMGKQIIYLSRFHNDHSGNGGDRRTAQICQLLSPLGYDFVSICKSPFNIPEKLHNYIYNASGYFSEKRSRLYKQRYTYSKYYKWSERFRDYLLYLHLQAHLFVDSLKEDPELLLIDDPVFFAPVVLHAKAKGIPIGAFCHNIETLSREQVEYSCQREMLKYELDLISMCDLVVTISTEETFLLRNLGEDPVYLPYFPLKQTAERFEEIRRRRHDRQKADFLLLGTVYNLPTLDGMKQIIAAITDNNILPDDRLIVAGYGTDQLLSYLDSPRIEVRGEVTDAELDEILTGSNGCIVYQDNGSGALTKISELLTAGVPVIINSHAARSHHNLPGIFEFKGFEQLGEQLQAAAATNQFPQVLSPPNTEALIKRIFELLR